MGTPDSVTRKFAKALTMFKFTLICLTLILLGCNSATPPAESVTVDQVAYDQKTKQSYVISGDVTLPTAHPNVPGSTLQPALFCSRCQKWYPAPPIEVLNRNPGAANCPRDSTPLTSDGPFPEERISIESTNGGSP